MKCKCLLHVKRYDGLLYDTFLDGEEAIKFLKAIIKDGIAQLDGVIGSFVCNRVDIIKKNEYEAWVRQNPPEDEQRLLKSSILPANVIFRGLEWD